MFYGKLPIKQTVPWANRAVLQLHPALNLLHRGPVHTSVQMPQQRPTVHWVLLLGRCKNRGRLMPSPTTVRGLLGHSPRGADPPATDLSAPTPPVQSPTSLSLRAILAAGAGGRSARGGASGRKGPREEGGRRSG